MASIYATTSHRSRAAKTSRAGQGARTEKAAHESSAARSRFRTGDAPRGVSPVWFGGRTANGSFGDMSVRVHRPVRDVLAAWDQ